jgi:hypothetical protein
VRENTIPSKYGIAFMMRHHSNKPVIFNIELNNGPDGRPVLNARAGPFKGHKSTVFRLSKAGAFSGRY